MDEPSSWVDRARATISAIAASHGHQLEWTADEPRRPGSRLGRYWRADCKSCPVPKSGRALILPLDSSENENHWLGGPEELIPAYLTRKCRQTREPLTRGPAPKYWDACASCRAGRPERCAYPVTESARSVLDTSQACR